MKLPIRNFQLYKNFKSKDEIQVSIYGELDQQTKDWINFHKLKVEKDKGYNNITVGMLHLFPLIFEVENYAENQVIDDFSPNLNKNLHIGHFANLIIGKAIRSLLAVGKSVKILGDTVTAEGISNDEQLNKFNSILDTYDNPNDSITPFTRDICLASIYDGDYIKRNLAQIIQDGEGEYKGTKVITLKDGRKLVVVKSDNSSTYFGQDVAHAVTIKSKRKIFSSYDKFIYVTGREQTEHFKDLKSIFENTYHIPMGLVNVKGSKMSSRNGTVIYMDDFIEEVMRNLNTTDVKLAYNVVAGLILKSNIETDKNINLDIIANPKNSDGLYISYTMARLISAGCTVNFNKKTISDLKLIFTFYKALDLIKPNILFLELVEYCKETNRLYNTHIIKDNPSNLAMFNEILNNIVVIARRLGLFVISKV